MGEFDLIARYFTRPTPRAALGVGDDCALLLPPDIAAQMARMMQGGQLDSGQFAQLAEPGRAMDAPLSPPEAIASIDEMSEIGMLSTAMSTELKECMLVLPQSAPAMGMAA